MKSYADIEYLMYQQSQRCRSVGVRKQIVEMIPWIGAPEPLLIGLLKCNPVVGEGKSHFYYIIYDVENSRVVDEVSEQYREYLQEMPSLDGLSLAGIKLDPFEEMKLREEMEKIIEEFCENRVLGTEALETVRRLSEGLSQAAKELYWFFIPTIRKQ